MAVVSSSIALISSLLEKSAKGTLEKHESRDIEALKDESNKQAVELQMAYAQAKVAQELAIAQRIQDATEVTIEEFYANENLGEAGAKANSDGLNLGLSGESRRVTKRIYKFKQDKT